MGGGGVNGGKDVCGCTEPLWVEQCTGVEIVGGGGVEVRRAGG